VNESVRLISDRSSEWVQRLLVLAAERIKELAAPWYHRVLAAIVFLAAFCDLYQLNAEGYGNTYYAAAIKSMLQSWHNFFFVAFDPGGFVTIDKPPLGFWIQAASAKLFGFSGFSILLPEAIAGVVSVAILYHLVARAFGSVAGLLAALALALMPVSVVTNRNNTIDSLLTLVMLLAAWAVLKAAESGQRGWLLAGAALVGLGFNVKMLEAYLIVPALALLYLLAAPGRLQTRLKQLALAGAVLLVVSLSWVTIVDLTPASARPYVGSSQTNSEFELAFGYNGIQRLTGLFRGRGAPGRTTGAGRAPTGTSSDTPDASRGTTAPPNAGGGGFGFETGGPSPLRLINQELGGQVSWLLPLALLGLLASGWGIWGLGWRALLARLRWRPAASATESGGNVPVAGAAEASLRRRPQAFILFGMWFLTEMVFFSVAGFFHSYYMVTMAPAVGALFGIGVVQLWRDFQHGEQGSDWRGWLLPLAFVLTALVQVHILANYPTQSAMLAPIVLVLSLGAATVLLAVCVRRAREQVLATSGAAPPWGASLSALATPGLATPGLAARVPPRARDWLARMPSRLPIVTRTALVIGTGALLLAPTTWVAISIAHPSGNLPAAGPSQRNVFNANFGRNPGAGAGATDAARQPDDTTQVEARLVRYLEANRGTTRYLLATQSAMTASPFILQTGQPVMALGGFSGSDPILTTDELVQRVADHDVRYFLLQGGRPFSMGDLPPDVQDIFAGDGPFAGGLFGGASSAAALTRWITTNCAQVAPSAWGGTTSATGGRGDGGQLYDCGALAATNTQTHTHG
jgi:4-amino-4-deoxy-L-arabinose transferase-like glycosyltransferase